MSSGPPHKRGKYGALERAAEADHRIRSIERTQRATRPSVFDDVFRALVWHMAVSRKTPRSWHVSQGFTLSENSGKAGIPGTRLVHTLETAGKAYYSQLWKLVTHSRKRDYATCYCHRRRREQAIAQHGVLRERYRATKKNLTATLYDLTNAFACGAQESQPGDPTSLADVVRGEVQNLTAREHFCQRLAFAQLRLECVDGQLAAKIGSGTLAGDTFAGGWFLPHFHPKLDVFLSATPELQINATLPFAIPNAPEALDAGTSTCADDTIREIRGTSAENFIAGINRSNDCSRHCSGT